MDLFDYLREDSLKNTAPLSVRIRPQTLEEIAGQKHILGKDKFLYRAIRADQLSSLILYGPPGTGKTTIAKVIANTTGHIFRQINATGAGKKDMEEVVSSAKDTLGKYRKKTILFIDEIHRFNKSQQDYLLPFVEDSTITLIGATTENPYFEVNQALLSRSMVFELKALTKEDILQILKRALDDKKRGLGEYQVQSDEAVLDFFAEASGGDARTALNALELAVLTTPINPEGNIFIDINTASDCIRKKRIAYDKSGDKHYDTVSAFIKSIRGSDPDAAVYYLARMIYAGEDVKFISRRMMIAAAEDIGLADPNALQTAVSAALAAERVGLPEAKIILAQAVIYLAGAPKSNSAVKAIFAAEAALEKTMHLEVPPHLRDAHYQGSKDLGRGLDYKYPHDYPKHYIKQQYLPSGMEEYRFYTPSGNGYEKEIADYMKYLKEDEE